MDLAALKDVLAPLFPGVLGVELLEIQADRVVATMRIRPELCTTGAVAHGGALMAFADTLGAVGTFVNLPAGARTTTVDSSTKFIGAAPVNSTVTGECVAFPSRPARRWSGKR
jgi:uncharacterized protein (TIGR00369 family)